MSREATKNLIDLVPENDINLVYQVIVRFIPEDMATHEELAAIEAGRTDIAENGGVSMDEIDWN